MPKPVIIPSAMSDRTQWMLRLVYSRFGSPLVLSRVHWVRPELVAEVKYLTWTEDNLLVGLREDKTAAEVRRAVPYPKRAEPARPATRAKRPRPG